MDGNAILDKANIELAFADELYYAILHKTSFFGTRQGFAALQDNISGGVFIPVFTTIEKAGAFLYGRHTGSEKSEIRKIEGANDAVAMAESLHNTGYAGVAIDPPMFPGEPYAVASPEKLAEWGTARQ